MNGLKSTPAQLQQRRQLCEDLEYSIREDKDLLATVIDEFVYNLATESKDEEANKAFSEIATINFSNWNIAIVRRLANKQLGQT